MPANDQDNIRRFADYQQNRAGTREASLKGGDGGGTFDDMEARVASLEKRFDRFEAKVDALIKDVAEIKGRVSTMPSTWQLVGLILAIMGASFTILKFTIAH
jgi:hypothetical protein